MATPTPECVDCKRRREAAGEPLPARPRKVVQGVKGAPRCATDYRHFRDHTKVNAHESRVRRVYGLGAGDYDRLYQHQGGTCALCQRSRGIAKKLAVDHDHDTGLAYGLLCGPCNKDVMGWSRRQIAYFRRCIDYIDNPPARQLGIVAYHEDFKHMRKDSDDGSLG